MITRRWIDFPAFGFKSPFSDLDRMKRQLDQLFGQATDEKGYPARRAGVFPLINLTENKNNYFIRAELPGVSAEELDIQSTDRNIAITGHRETPADESAGYHRREREFGRFSRAFTLPGEIERDKIDATLKNGILTITIPKAEEAKPKQIKIR
ncbi:MAG: Hsp20/alpha crystallin family protein [Deltaproteobacteria bacterium]|nr:Hsp20/alpha crystallin family protein [Deltaproteobacteria bacterium]